jgi:hypothetical protein
MYCNNRWTHRNNIRGLNVSELLLEGTLGGGMSPVLGNGRRCGLSGNLTPVCSPKCSLGSRRTKMPRAAPSYKRGGPRKRRSDGEDWIMGPSPNRFCARWNLERRRCHRRIGMGARYKAPGTPGESNSWARLMVGPSLELAA